MLESIDKDRQLADFRYKCELASVQLQLAILSLSKNTLNQNRWTASKSGRSGNHCNLPEKL